MSRFEFFITYALNLVFWLWVVRWGGAQRLEGTFSSGFLIHMLAPRWSADGIRLFGYGAILVSTVVFVIGLFFPEFRDFL